MRPLLLKKKKRKEISHDFERDKKTWKRTNENTTAGIQIIFVNDLYTLLKSHIHNHTHIHTIRLINVKLHLQKKLFMWRNKHSYTWLVGMQNSAATLKDNLETSFKSQ